MTRPEYHIGVDVGGTSVRAAVVDANGEVIDRARTATPGELDALEDAVAELITGLAGRHPVRAVGLAVAGFVSADKKTVLFSPHLAWRNADVASAIGNRIGLPVVLEHDTNAAAIAEYRLGAARGSRLTVLLALGTGIGAALLTSAGCADPDKQVGGAGCADPDKQVGGAGCADPDKQVGGAEPFAGGHGVAPELGHLTLVPDGRPCPCGKRGCWERYCSGTALAATAVELLAENPGVSTVLASPAATAPAITGEAITGEAVAAAASDGDPIALLAMAELARWLGRGLALVADVYDPELIVLGGGVSASAPLFVDAAREHYAELVTGAGHRPLASVRTAQLGADAGMIGASLLAADT